MGSDAKGCVRLPTDMRGFPRSPTFLSTPHKAFAALGIAPAHFEQDQIERPWLEIARQPNSSMHC